jgi:hypothetical protein
MLNPFPLQWLALLAYLVVRVAVGLVLLLLAKRQLKKTEQRPRPKLLLAVVMTEILTGTALILGMYTQYAALATLVLCLLLGGGRRLIGTTKVDPLLLTIMGAAAISLFITGAGTIAFDLPL